jgi:hypothetical protein
VSGDSNLSLDGKTLLQKQGVDWIHLAQDRGQWRAPVNTVMNRQVPYATGDLLISWATVSFSRNILSRIPHGHRLPRCSVGLAVSNLEPIYTKLCMTGGPAIRARCRSQP